MYDPIFFSFNVMMRFAQKNINIKYVSSYIF